jgi:hypothetical protein
MNYEEEKLRKEIVELMQEEAVTALIIKWSTLGILMLVFLVVGGMIGCPRYKVYQQNLEGKAELVKATQNRQIAIQEAQAKYESAHFNKLTDSIRAVGIHISNTIIGQSLRDNEAYLKWLWITDVAGANIDKTIVYIPTETNLPILETNRLNKQQFDLTIPVDELAKLFPKRK